MSQNVENEKNEITISVIMPVYNAKDYLKVALDSICEALKGIPHEIICIDDGSTDGSAELLDICAEACGSIKVYHRENKGAAASRNYAIKKACGKYIAFTDSDDFVASNMYRDMLFLCETNDVDLCVCNVTRFEGNFKGVVSGQYQRAFEDATEKITTIEESSSFIYDGSPCNKLIRRSFWEKKAFSFPELGHYEDMPLILKLYCEVDRFAVLQSFGYYWRITPGGKSISQQVGSVQTLLDRMGACRHMLNYLKNRYGEDSCLMNAMKRRLLYWEFDSNLWHFEKLDIKTRMAFCDKLKEFYNETISEADLDDIPLFHKKRYEYIMSGDTESLVRLMNHRRMGWRTAPIVEKGGKHFLKLPEDIYGETYTDAAIELQDDLPVSRMSVFEQAGSKVIINAVVYQPRINAPEADSQEVKAFMYNEHTGQKINLDCVPLKVEPWTKTYGKVICNDDYRVYEYNYDWAGVTITIDFEDVCRQDAESRKILDENKGIKPRFLIFTEYRNPICECVRPLRGFLPKANKSIPTLDVAVENSGVKYRYDFIQSIRESLYIEVDKV